MNTAVADIPDRRRSDSPVASSDPELAQASVIAFATDPGTERVLHDGLTDVHDAQVWSGGLRAAAAALRQGQSPQLLFVDLDQTPYPAGAIHELSAVCEIGTVVIALGSDGTARFSREVLRAGVSDYLVKPITGVAVREAATRAVGATTNRAAEGWLVGFAGTGGSGATTLAAATALLAAERGRYVSVLDLNRTFSALSFALDVEPGGGLVDLLSTVARASLHPEMVDGIRAERSDRIAVYGYPASVEPLPLAPVWAVCELLVELQRRSHLVIVDGMDDPATRQTLLAMFDARVFVVEPTVAGAMAAGRMLARLGPMRGQEWPMLLVQNYTRAFRAKARARAFGRGGVATVPDVVVPFEPTLPALADRGWPQGRMPPTLREPLNKLTERLLTMADGDQVMTDAREIPATPVSPRVSPARGRRTQSSPARTAPSRPSRVGAALRRFVSPRTARPPPAPSRPSRVRAALRRLVSPRTARPRPD